MNNQFENNQNTQMNENVVISVNNNRVLKYAGFGARLGAYLLDGLALFGKAIITFLVLMLLSVVLKTITGSSIAIIGVLEYLLPAFIMTLGMIIYRGRKDSKGQTFGRKQTKTIVLDENGNEISTGKSFSRQLLNFIFSGVGILVIINIILVITDQKKQSLTDKLLKTVVVYK